MYIHAYIQLCLSSVCLSSLQFSDWMVEETFRDCSTDSDIQHLHCSDI